MKSRVLESFGKFVSASMNLIPCSYFKEFRVKSVLVLTNDSFILYNETHQHVSGLYSSGNQWFFK